MSKSDFGIEGLTFRACHGNLSHFSYKVTFSRSKVKFFHFCLNHGGSNPAAPSSSPALTTTWICFSVALSSNPGQRSVNSQLVCLLPVGILNNIMLNLNYLFQLFARPH